ncbi:MAG TPA: hypothetical protein VGP93_14660, partial [Polyangiaceae bacterium]|nr:hypothetical protein [Polyangiaceae bacterium]
MARRSKTPPSLTANLSLAPPLPAVLGPVASFQALLALVAANTFDELKVNVALWVTGDWWYPVHLIEGQGVLAFEYAHGVAARRWAYNNRCFEQVRLKRRIVRGEHAGFCDLF